MDYGASKLANSPEECVDLINLYLQNPSIDYEGREKARNLDCGPLDGNSGKRIAKQINELSFK